MKEIRDGEHAATSTLEYWRRMVELVRGLRSMGQHFGEGASQPDEIFAQIGDTADFIGSGKPLVRHCNRRKRRKWRYFQILFAPAGNRTRT